MYIRAKGWLESLDWSHYGIIASIYLIWQIGVGGGWSTACWMLLLICLLGVRKDQVDVDWKRFFVFGLPLLYLFYYFYGAGNSLWWNIANWMFENNRHPWDWDHAMNSIPFNDAAWARAFNTPALDAAMVWVYNYGFVLSLWLCIVRSFWTRSIKKMLTYALSGHIMQFPLILPFYNLIMLREVWYVKGQPDLLGRVFETEGDLTMYVMNCFPSMHTSIAFAMLLVSLREKDRIFKYMMVTYCSLIIISTMYLQIHWVLDVFAGMAFAFGTVKLADLVIRVASNRLPKWLKSYYHKKHEKAYRDTMAA
jgi:membrane-associated phospholipid phosphatase